MIRNMFNTSGMGSNKTGATIDYIGIIVKINQSFGLLQDVL